MKKKEKKVQKRTQNWETQNISKCKKGGKEANISKYTKVKKI